MPQDEIDHLNQVIVAINQQLTAFAEIIEKMAKWPDNEFKQKAFDKIFAQQDYFAKESQKIFDRLDELNVSSK